MNSDSATVIGILLALLVTCMAIIYMMSEKARDFERCIVDGQWRVIERTTARIPTDQDHVSILKWDWHMQCESNPSINIVYRHERPTIFRIDQVIDWSPK